MPKRNNEDNTKLLRLHTRTIKSSLVHGHPPIYQFPHRFPIAIKHNVAPCVTAQFVSDTHLHGYI